MKKGWTYDKLGDICKLYQPHTISSKEMVDDGKYDVFGANGIIGKYNKYNHEEPEILMTCRGATCGNINVSTPKSWINGNAMVVHIKDEKTLNKSFLIYILSHIDKTHIITGAAQPQITRQTLSPLMIGYPTLSEQERIVERLDAAFAQIDELKSNAEKQLAEARALFQSALTQAMQPKPGWQEKTLGNVGTFIRGGNFTKKDFVEDGFPCIHYGQIHTKFGVATYEHLSCVPKAIVKAERCASKGDLVIAITSEDDEGSCKCTAWMADYDAYVGGHTAIFKHCLNPIFVSYYFKAERFQKAKLEYTHGFKVVEISPKDIAKISISYPPVTEQQSIVDSLNSLKSKVDRLQENFIMIYKECDAMKQALLRQIFE